MKVRVQFFAQLRDLVGSETFETNLANGTTISDLVQELYRQFPQLREHDKGILFGAGVEFVDRNYKLKADEEIAIMPPVQGG